MMWWTLVIFVLGASLVVGDQTLLRLIGLRESNCWIVIAHVQDLQALLVDGLPQGVLQGIGIRLLDQVLVENSSFNLSKILSREYVECNVYVKAPYVLRMSLVDLQAVMAFERFNWFLFNEREFIQSISLRLDSKVFALTEDTSQKEPKVQMIEYYRVKNGPLKSGLVAAWKTGDHWQDYVFETNESIWERRQDLTGKWKKS